MAYDVDHKPGTWVMTQSLRREHLVFSVAALFLCALVLVFVGAAEGYRLSGLTSVLLLVSVVIARPYANRYIDKHFRLLEGAIAEETVGETLNELRRETGWVVMHDVEQAFEGNIDHLVSGPTGAFLVETKLHRYANADLTKAKRQAAKLGHEFEGWVTPVICLRTRRGKAFRDKDVWVVPHERLLGWLHEQRNEPVPFERLALYAEKL